MAKSAQAFRTIREVADWLGVAAHVLRFWESKFQQIRPVKRAGGRRYYRPDDIALIGGIKTLLHDRGFTIRGVQKMIAEDGEEAVAALAPSLETLLETSDPEAWEDDAEPDTEQHHLGVEDAEVIAEAEGDGDAPESAPTEQAGTQPAEDAPLPAEVAFAPVAEEATDTPPPVSTPPEPPSAAPSPTASTPAPKPPVVLSEGRLAALSSLARARRKPLGADDPALAALAALRDRMRARHPTP